MNLKKSIIFNLFFLTTCFLNAQELVSLKELQQDFVDLKFGMFIHYNIPTYMEDDWADPNAKPDIFNPSSIDYKGWAKAAKSANMSYGCLTTKHHSGFCIWNTQTTDYNITNSPYKKDIVEGYVNAFREEGLKVMLYYSILDTHHEIRPGKITNDKVQMIKDQLTELLTNYGKIDALVIDGWDAPWSRISYEAVPFEEVYNLIKSLQPQCLVMDLNAAKYPKDALFYTDIKSFEQNAGQHIEKDKNSLPAMSCLPLQQNWFWKPWTPKEQMKNPIQIVNDNIIPLNNVHCNFMLNVAPNRDGNLDANALEALSKIGELWKPTKKTSNLPKNYDSPIISKNLAKFQPTNSSWSNDMNLMDFANDDDFSTSWQSHASVKKPWWEVQLLREIPFNMIVITESTSNIDSYSIEYFKNNKWHKLLEGKQSNSVKVHRFKKIYANKLKIVINKAKKTPSISEFGVYYERI